MGRASPLSIDQQALIGIIKVNFTITHIVLLKVLFLGALLSMVIYVWLRYLFLKDRAARYYLVYAIVLIIAFTFQLDRYPSLAFLQIDPPYLHYLFHDGLINLAFIVYIFFASAFLDAPTRYPRVHRMATGTARITLALWIIHMILAAFIPGSPLLQALHYTEFTIVMALGIIGAVTIMRHPSYLEKLLFAGIASLLMAGFYKVFILLLPAAKAQALPEPYTVLMIAIVAELLVYAGAIGYKVYRVQRELIRYNKTLIGELEVNRGLQGELRSTLLKYQDHLEGLVEERTREVIQKSEDLQEEQLRKTREAYKRMSLERELRAIRSQMSPHFLFNCLNMVSAFVMGNQKAEAMDIIQQFSKLLRLVLNNSMHPQVAIEKEMQTLKLYLQLEAVRYNHIFSYVFDIEPELLSDDYGLPPMLLQPFVENAIRHVLSNHEGTPGRVVISLRLDGGHIVCEIGDNGIRSDAAPAGVAEEDPDLPSERDVTMTKINLAKEFYREDASVEIIDFDDPGPGSAVRIRIPA